MNQELETELFDFEEVTDGDVIATPKDPDMHEYGTTEEQMAKMAADQRFNALDNHNAVFNGQPASKEDVLNSRYINEPLKLLESVMPCDGAAALIITSPERAKSISKRPAYILGV